MAHAKINVVCKKKIVKELAIPTRCMQGCISPMVKPQICPELDISFEVEE